MGAEIFDFQSGKRLTPEQLQRLTGNAETKPDTVADSAETRAQALVKELGAEKMWNENSSYFEQELEDARAKTLPRLEADLMRSAALINEAKKHDKLRLYVTSKAYLEKMKSRRERIIAEGEDELDIPPYRPPRGDNEKPSG